MYSKQRNAGNSRLNESTLFKRIYKHSFEGLGADTRTFCESTPFSGEVVGGLSAFSKDELRFPILFVYCRQCTLFTSYLNLSYKLQYTPTVLSDEV